jgi:hypothetical protein
LFLNGKGSVLSPRAEKTFQIQLYIGNVAQLTLGGTGRDVLTALYKDAKNGWSASSLSPVWPASLFTNIERTFTK